MKNKYLISIFLSYFSPKNLSFNIFFIIVPPSEKKVFLREATGLVREISPIRAMFFNFCAMSGGIVVLNYIYSAFYPASPTFGLSSLDLAQILSAIALIPYSLIFIVLLSRIPRTGGDYVFTSRILSPYVQELNLEAHGLKIFPNLNTLLRRLVFPKPNFLRFLRLFG